MKEKENFNRFKRIFKIIFNIISWTVLAVLLIVAVFLAYYYIVSKIYEKKGEQYEPSIGLYTIVSPSMTPNLNVYDVIIDTKVKKPEDIKVGDIITFISQSRISKGLTITHRVVAIVETENGPEYKTQGDNNLSPDTATVPFDKVLGKVLFRIPKLGKIQHFLSSSSGWLVIVVVPALCIILGDVLKILKLADAKKKVTYALNTEEQQIEKEELKKEEIKTNLKKRYQIKRRESEPDPLKTNQKLRKVIVQNEVTKDYLPKEEPEIPKDTMPSKKTETSQIELPKLKK